MVDLPGSVVVEEVEADCIGCIDTDSARGASSSSVLIAAAVASFLFRIKNNNAKIV